MNTKRILPLILSLLMVLCITLGLTACEDILGSIIGGDTTCQHQWKDATCTEAKVCTLCGETDGDPLGHTVVTDKAVAPTCTESGLTEGSHCSVCKKVIKEQTAISPKGHTYGEWYVAKDATCEDAGVERRDCSCGHFETRDVSENGHDHKAVVTAPTCTEQGYTTYTCACGNTYIADFVPATDHAWDEGKVTTEATCVRDGVLTKTCKNGCGETKTESIPAKGHDHKSVVTAPTCEEQGYTTYTCACGDTFVADYVPATGHSWDEGKVTTEATCVKEGVLTKTCKNGCGETKTESIPAKGHDHKSVVTAPTCTEQGYTEHTCACGDTYNDTYVDALGHDFGEWEEVENPESEDGNHIRYCSRCDEEETDPHDFTTVVTAPTCEEQGYTTYTCGCGYSKVDNYIAATGHSWDDGEVTTEATCEGTGVLTKTCENGCGETKTESIPATGHTHESVVTAPTCEEQGYTTHTCHCGDTYVDTYVVATGHSWDEGEVTTEATCVEEGVLTKTCENGCGETKTEAIPVKDHTYESVVTAPTCTEQGYTTHTCVCGDTYKDAYVAALNHAWNQGEVTTEATCLEAGVLTRKCLNGCGETKTEEIPAKGHDYKTKVTAPTCTERGYTTYTCACGDTYKADYVPATEHSYSKVVTAPTCTEGGYTTYTCTGCNDTYKDDETEALGHVGGEANCENGPVCSVCGVEYGEALGHKMVPATCTEAAYCENCDHTEGEALGHTGGTATCTTLAVCERCGKEHGELEPHDMAEATCTEAEHCKNCDYAVGSALGHTGGAATCTELAVCERCNETYGSLLSHEYTVKSTEDRYLTTPANCEDAAVYAYSCVCGEKGSETFVYGEALGHSYDSWKSNGDGTHTHTCARCDDVETENCSGGAATCTLAAVCDTCKEYYGEALGHSYGEGTVSTPAGCTTDGVKTYTCTCGATKTEAIPATGHSYKSEATAPTCTAKGYTTHTCQNEGCQHSYVDSYVDAKGHEFGKWTVEKAATCVATGLEVRVCGVCGHSETNTLAALGHDYAHVVTAPTCTTKGYTTHTCTVCGDSYVDSYVKEAAHSFAEKVTAPNCTEKGYTTYTCTNENCGYFYVGNYTDAIDHSYGDWYVEKAATCTAAGIERHDCKNCAHFETKVIAAAGHDYSTKVTAPSCTEKGYTTYTCKTTGCGHTYVSDYVDAKGHDYDTVVTAPTCTAKGYTTYTCHCGDKYVSDYTDETGHNFDAVVTAPTCVEKGYTTYTCKNSGCQHTYIADFKDANGHSWNINAPTCTEDQVCSVCGETNEATGHDIYLESTTPASCTAAAVNNYKCHNCEEYSRQESVGTPTEHNIIGVTPELVLKEGETCVYTERYTCADCGTSVVGKEVVTHEKYTASITKAATCVEEGIKTLTCAACGETKTEAIPVDTELGHAWDEGTLVGTTRTYACQREGCEATKSVYDASGETSANVNSEDLKNEVALKDANLDFSGASDIDGDVTIGAGTLDDETKKELLDKVEGGASQVGDNPVYNFTISDASENDVKFGGTVTITLPYVLEEGEDVDSIAVWYINENGEFESIKATYSNGYVSFEVTHFSFYTVTKLTPKQRCQLYGHNETSMVVDPTCTEQGYTLYNCIRCDHSRKVNLVDPIDHRYTVKEIAADCTTSGLKTYTCATCTHSYTEEIAPRGHVYGSGVVTVPATCTTAGLMTYTCDCGVEKTEAIPSIGHNYDDFVVTAPTCTEKGYTTYTCTNNGCDHTYVDDYKDAKGHIFGDWYVYVAPTCIMHGVERRDCTGCDHFETNLINAKGHDYNETVTAPTCIEQGYTTFVCKNDGCRDNYVGAFVPAKGHEHQATVTAPTCISKGYTTYVCHCGNTYVADYTATIDHSYESVVTDPTCISKGYTTFTCKIEGCEHTYMDNYTNAVDHSYGEWTTVTSVTCTENGLNRRDCENCDHFENEIVEALGHKYNVVVTAPTCTEQGYTTYSCENDGCGHVYTSDYVPAKGHSYESVVTDPTCDEAGYTTHSCTCGDEYTDNYTSPTGHDYEAEWEWEDDYRHAWINVRCNHERCHHHDNPHRERIEAEVRGFDSTCDKNGRDEYHVHFEFGGKSFSDKREVEREKNKHNYHDVYQWNKEHHWFKCSGCSGNSGKIPHEFDEGTVTITPNCIRDGEITYKCVCGYTKTEKLSKTETHTASKEVYHNAEAHWNVCIHCGEVCNVNLHQWDEGRVTKNANCSEEGIMTYRCSCTETKTEAIPTNNSHSYKDDLAYDENSHWGECVRCGNDTDVVAHEFGDWKTIKASSCTEEGARQHKCACGYTETEAIPVVEHTYIVKTNDDEHWNECRVCGGKSNVESHNHETEIKFELPSCISEGIRITACACGHWSVEILPPNDIHEYSVPAFDENGHWTECRLCGHKSQVEKHNYNEENAVVVTAPTCIRDGYAEIECDCGHKTAITLEATGIHEYENGICKHCGAEEIKCDHEIKKVVIDFTELGYCGGSLTYYGCDCGEYTDGIHNLDIKCENVKYTNENQGMLDNGSIWAEAEMECLDCGLHVYLHVIQTIANCESRYEYNYIFYNSDGSEKLNLQLTDIYEYHQSEIPAVVGLAEKTCGTEVHIYKCADCGVVTRISSIDEKCNFVVDDPEFVLDENGNPIMVKQSGTCPDCGLTESVIMTAEWLSPCSYIYSEHYTFEINGELLFEWGTSQEMTEHNYEFTYEPIGENCEEGVMVTITCSTCGDTFSDISYDHVVHNEEFNTSDFGMCNGFGNKEICQVCNKVVSISVHYTDCWYDLISVDETGLEIWRCNNCGVENHRTTIYSEKDEYCDILATIVDKYYINGELVLDATHTERWNRHNDQYTYELLGESCEYGYRVYVVCLDCGYSWDYTSEGHHYTEEVTDLGELGLCPGTIYRNLCTICGKTESYIEDSCNWVTANDVILPTDTPITLFIRQAYTAKVLYLDGGIDRDRYLTTTEDPAAAITIYAEKSGVGYAFYHIVDGQKMYINVGYNSAAKMAVYYSAESASVFTYRIDVNAWVTFVDGVEYFLGTYSSYNTFSPSMSSYITPENTGVSQFPAEIAELVVSEEEKTVCSTCGAEKRTSMEEIWTGSCDYQRVYTHEYYLNGTLVCTGVERTYHSQHNNNVEYFLHGENCEDGYEIVYTCIICDSQYSEYGYGHNNVIEKISLSDYGITCGGTHYKTSCTICHNVTEEWVEETCDWHMAGVTMGEEATVPTENTAYAAYMDQRIAGARVYLDGGTSGRYLTTTTDPTKAIIVYAEAHEGGYAFYTLVDGEKLYITVGYNVEGKLSIAYDYYNVTVYAYYAELGAWVTMIDGIEYYIGSYNAFETISASKLSYITPENTGVNQFPIKFAEISLSEGGTYEVCSVCGTEKHYSEELIQNGCNFTKVDTVSYVVSGQTVLSVSDYSYYSDHDYKPTFIMYGTSCEEGYDVTYTCTGCGDSFVQYYNYHEIFRVYEADFESSNSCKHHFAYFDSCPCGEVIDDIYFDVENLVPMEPEMGDTYSKQGYICEDCGFSIVITYSIAINGCIYTETVNLDVIIDGVVDYNYNMSYDYEQHDIRVSYTAKEDGSFIVAKACSVCGEGTVTESQVITITYNEELGYSSYDLYFTPEKDGTYYLYSVCTTDTDAILYEVLEDGTLSQLTTSSNRYSWKNFGIKKTLKAGSTYVYRIYSRKTMSTVVVPYVLVEVDKSFDAKHATFTYYEAIPEDYIPCKDAIYAVYLCDCGCGYVGHVESLGVNGEHEYNEEGFCQNCGTECSHEANKLTYINLADYGLCGGIVMYYTCDCGQASEMNPYDAIENMVHLNCENMVSENMSGGYLEDGRIWQRSISECSDCGLCVELYATLEQTACTAFAEGAYSFYLTRGGEAILVCDVAMKQHNPTSTEYISLNLGDKVCGGDMTIQVCKNCGEALYIGEPTLTCNLIEEDLGTYYFDYGMEYRVRVYCPDCGFEIILTQYEYNKNCTITRGYKFDIIAGGELVYELDVIQEQQTNHSWYKYYEYLSGDNCSDGAILHIGCSGCGFAAQYITYGHQERYECHVDGTEFGFCPGTTVVIEKCEHCGENITITGMHPEGCNWVTTGIDEATGAEIQICIGCGAVRHYGYFESEKDENCKITITNYNDYYVNGELVVNLTSSYYETRHNFEQSYELIGENCDNGYYVHNTCQDCGYTTTHTGYGHNTVYENINWIEHGVACGGYGYRHVCQICGEQTHSYGYTHCDYAETGVDEATGAIIYTCQNENCGSTKKVLETKEDINSCQYNIIVVVEYYSNSGTLIFTTEEQSSYEVHQWVYEYIFDDPSIEDCDNGVTVNYSCSVCGESGRDHSAGHSNYRIFTADFAALGCCTNKHEFYYDACPCGAHYNYSFQSGMHSSDGVNYFCPDCGYTVNVFEGEIKDGCTINMVSTIVMYVDGVEVYRIEISRLRVMHDFDITASIAEDGSYSLSMVCKNCQTTVTTDSGMSESHIAVLEYNNGSYYYDFVFTPSESAYYTITSNSSEDTYVELYMVVNGKYNHLGSDDDGGNGLNFKLSHYLEAGVEYVYRIRFYNRNSGEIPFTIGTSVETVGDPNCEYHNYNSYDMVTVLPEGHSSCEEGSFNIEMCSCGKIVNVNVVTYHETSLKKVIDISEFGGCETVFYIYSCACGLESRVDYNNNCSFISSDVTRYVDENGVEHTVDISVCRYCGLVRERDYYNGLEGCNEYRYSTYIFFMEGTEIASYEEKSHQNTYHSYVYTYEFDDPSNQNCEAGVTVTATCSGCGASWAEKLKGHSGIIENTYSFADYGAVGGYAKVYECPCGEYSHMQIYTCGHGWYGNSSEYTDEEGIRWYVESNWTEECECNIRYDRKYYYTYNTENCTRVAHIFETVSVGNNLIARCERAENQEWHDYEISYTLHGVTCSDGVSVVNTCRNCGTTQEQTWYWCNSIELERIYIEEFGSVCGGYVSLYGCACGNSFEFRVSGADCHFDHKGTNDFVEGDIDYYQNTAEGQYGFYTYSYIYTCSVTHPEQCGFAIRYSEYWKKNDDCSATYYLTMQFGYDEQAGTYVSERTVALGSRTYHNYESVSIENGEKYECPDCGSYYSYTYEYNENGYQTKHSEIYVNTLDDGCNKYREYTYEYLGEYMEHFGNPQTLSYYKYIYADGSESWDKYEYTYTVLDETPYGDFAWTELCISTNSSGYWHKSEQSMFSYEGYSFTFSNYREESNGSWYKYDYAYDFTDGCMRTETYTNSSGEYRVNGSQSAHPSWWHKTIKEPTCTQPGIQANWCVVCEHTWNESYTNPTEHNWVMLNNGIYYCYDCGLQNINGATGDIVMEDLTEEYGNGEAYVIGYYLKSNHQFTPFVLITLHEPVIVDGEEYFVFILDLTEEQIHFVEDEYIGIYVTLADIEAAVADVNEAYGLALTSDMYDVTITLVPDGADSLFDYAITFADLPGADEIDYVIKTTEFIVEYVAEGKTVEFTICPETSGYWDIEVWSEYGSDFYIYDSFGSMIHGSGAGHHITQPYFTAGETYTLTFRMYNYTYECYVAFSFTQVIAE